MKVCLVNTADSGGGAPVACRRLLQALEQKVDTKMLVQEKKTNEENVVSTVKTGLDVANAQANFLLERIPFMAFYEKDKSVRFAFSTANTGTEISKNTMIKEAEILHLHWVNSGFLSNKNIKNIFRLNKPIVWTLHDMWPFTGGCHYAGDCNHYLNHCGNCKFLRQPKENDLSKKGWLKKQAIYEQNENVVFVACSKWLAKIAKSSALLSNFRVEAIPNPIKTEIYKPLDKKELQKKWNIAPNSKVILFGAANINDQRKGISYLLKALEIMKLQRQDINIQILLFGKNKLLDTSNLPFPTKGLSVINNEKDLVEIYNLADVFVLPSLEDNLPNMVMESLSCGIPVVAFNQGGIPEMLDHLQNGYVAKYKSAEDLAKGIQWILDYPSDDLKNYARKKVLENYTEEIIAERYIKVYQSLL